MRLKLQRAILALMMVRLMVLAMVLVIVTVTIVATVRVVVILMIVPVKCYKPHHHLRLIHCRLQHREDTDEVIAIGCVVVVAIVVGGGGGRRGAGDGDSGVCSCGGSTSAYISGGIA
ncbi:Hypothetical predicted protein [Octopus vulgaris]|uniref:Uncharacterized protein n=1 Tax=Octopus vulgaris TaxID=6645 RepID=A0AA36EZA4_OCTVU|nr:Hypothetical predicted protein [Octopus vulgaris]